MYKVMNDGVFWSVQGEGHLRGFQMAFVRLAGCSVGCKECDTDYSPKRASSMTAEEIADAVQGVAPESVRDFWVWITGGEPLDYDLKPLIKALKQIGCSVAVATSGKHRLIPPIDWISVSYHGQKEFMQRYGSEIKLIVGLNGLDPFEFIKTYPDDETDFFYRYVQPVSIDGVEQYESLALCKKFISENPNWALSRQDHVYWGMP